MTQPETRTALVDRLSQYDSLVEIGVGDRTDVASALARRGNTVSATDIRPCSVPEGVTFVHDSITEPEASVYTGADAIYALNCPPELQRAMWTAANRADAACLFTTLGGDPPLLEVERETLPGETLFRVCSGPKATRSAFPKSEHGGERV